MRRLILLAVIAGFAAVGCGEAVEDASPTSSAAEATATTEAADTTATTEAADTTATTEAADTTATTEPRASDEDSAPEETSTSTTVPPSTGAGEGGLVAAITQDLMDRTGTSEDDIVVVRSDGAIWEDGSLGCPVPGETYSDAPVNGYWVVLETGGESYDYRATDGGYFRLCEGSGSPPSNPTG